MLYACLRVAETKLWTKQDDLLFYYQKVQDKPVEVILERDFSVKQMDPAINQHTMSKVKSKRHTSHSEATAEKAGTNSEVFLTTDPFFSILCCVFS